MSERASPGQHRMNRLERRARGVEKKAVHLKLEEWLKNPDRLVTRGDVMAFMELHRRNDHAKRRKPWWRLW